jgi:hypothetical protein
MAAVSQTFTTAAAGRQSTISGVIAGEAFGQRYSALHWKETPGDVGPVLRHADPSWAVACVERPLGRGSEQEGAAVRVHRARHQRFTCMFSSSRKGVHLEQIVEQVEVIFDPGSSERHDRSATPRHVRTSNEWPELRSYRWRGSLFTRAWLTLPARSGGEARGHILGQRYSQSSRSSSRYRTVRGQPILAVQAVQAQRGVS